MRPFCGGAGLSSGRAAGREYHLQPPGQVQESASATPFELSTDASRVRAQLFSFAALPGPMAAGMETVACVPLPYSLPTETVPPCSSAIHWTMDTPGRSRSDPGLCQHGKSARKCAPAPPHGSRPRRPKRSNYILLRAGGLNRYTAAPHAVLDAVADQIDQQLRHQALIRTDRTAAGHPVEQADL